MSIFYTLGTEDGAPFADAGTSHTHDGALKMGRSFVRQHPQREAYVIKVTTQVVSNRVRP